MRNFLAAMLEILEVRPPAELPRNAGRRDAWVRLGPWLRGLGDKYRKRARRDGVRPDQRGKRITRGDSDAPLVNPGRVDALQVRCGRWMDWTLKRYGAALASQPTVEVEVTKESLNAADRLAAMERAGT